MKNAINYILSVALVLAPTASIATPRWIKLQMKILN